MRTMGCQRPGFQLFVNIPEHLSQARVSSTPVGRYRNQVTIYKILRFKKLIKTIHKALLKETKQYVSLYYS